MSAKNNKPPQAGGPEGVGDYCYAGAESEQQNCTAKPVAFTVFESLDRLTKSYALGVSGTLIKTPAANMTDGKAWRVSVDFAQFGAELSKASERVAFGYGLHDSEAFGESVKITIAAKADPARGILARSREFFDYRPGPGVVMIDHDPHPDGPTVTPDELLGILGAVCPAFAGAACWVRGSVSSGVYVEGGTPKPRRGFHAYFAVADALDIPRFGKALFKRLWLAGHGFIAISSAGSFLVRGLIDAAVFDGERLDFVGKPVIGPGLRYKPPVATYRQGGYLNTQGLADLDESEESQFKALVTQAKAAREPDRQAKRARWEETQVRAMMGRGVAEPQARAQVRQIPADGKPGDLYRDWPLEFATLGFATVADVLANPARYDGAALADPIEGISYGRTTAKFFANPGGKPYINSHAHGGCKYFLKPSMEPETLREEPPFDLDYYEQYAPLGDEDGALLVDALSIQSAPKRQDKTKPRRGLAGGKLQDPQAVGRQAAPRRTSAKQTRAVCPSDSVPDPRAHAPAPFPTQPTQTTRANDFLEFSPEITLHQAYTELHPSYRDRLNGYTQANGCLIETDAKGNPRLVAESVAAENAAMLMGNLFRYNAQAGVWHRFHSTHWAVVSEAETLPHISAILTNGTEGIGFKQAYLNGVATILKKADMLPLPICQPGKIPFSNGLYDIAVGTLEPLTRDNALTWAIPHAFTEQADCPKFKAWLAMALGTDAELIEFIRAFNAACLTGRADLQKFLMLLGPGGTGKGTFLRLLTEMLGPSNCTTTDLKNLEQNRFETAALYGKRLAAITDAGRYVGSIDTLKAITGQDELRREEKHRQQGGTFRFEGMVLIASNEQLATTDYTSGLERRLMVVKFTRRFSPEEKAGFLKHQGEAELQAEIPAIIQWALGLSKADVTRLFLRPPKVVADWSMEALTEQNPVLEWIMENLEPDSNTWTPIGERGEKRDHGIVTFMDSDSKLYPNYLHFCYQSKREALALTRFRNTVIDMLGTLKIRAETKRRSQGMGILGVRLRPKVL